MATQLQLRRGTDAQNDAFTGAQGEVTVDTTNDRLRVHDGATQGGFPIAKVSDIKDMTLYSYATNCITEIPQDINLTLSNGTLTLKAGSKIYVPNGAGNFDVVNITADKTRTAAIGTQCVEIALLNKSNLSFNQLYEVQLSKICSGTTDALAGQSYHLWYDTTNNLIKYYGADGTTNNYYAPFPLGLVNGNGSQITSIDQVFNGFGYIGSTVFALPGVKGLIPNGRNADGTLKTTQWTTSSVVVRTFTDTNKTDLAFSGTSFGQGSYHLGEDGYLYNSANILVTSTVIGTLDRTSGIITDMRTKQPFHAVDYSDSDYIANCAMPSGRYTDLTLGNDNDPLTAPADGYYMLSKTSGATGERVGFQGRVDSFVYSSDSGQGLVVYIPVRKGDTVSVRFTATGATNRFRFIYANGAK